MIETVSDAVAPRTGAWIETLIMVIGSNQVGVAPRAGAWIETKSLGESRLTNAGRSPRGSVD